MAGLKLAVRAGPLTPEEQSLLDFYDAKIDEEVQTAGRQSWVEVDAPALPAKVLSRLKETWEARDRKVAVFPPRGAGENYRFVISPEQMNVLPAMGRGAVVAAEVVSGPRLLVRMPTRGRPVQAVSTLTAYRHMAGIPVLIEVVIDDDDESMLAAEVLQRLVALGCTVTVGPHKSKVEAVNGGRVGGWDILLLASDDMVPVVEGYAKRVVEEMERHFPYGDGVIYFNDGYAEGYCTLPIIGRRIHEQFNSYVYEPIYRSLWCDKEQTELLRAMGRLAHVDEMVIEHRHPATGKAPSDSTYVRNEAALVRDFEIYEQRRNTRRPHAQFNFDSPPLALSICICTVPSRRAQLDRLLDHLYRQASREVEILVDSGEGEIGAKRQRLLERALGHYVAFVDDDDWVSHDYVRRIVDAICASDYQADCVALWGAMTANGERPAKFHHSIEHDGWYTDNRGVYCRTPNHLNPVRRELALKVGFPSKSHGEDHEYARRLKSLLKTEVRASAPYKAAVVDAPLYYYWFWDTKPEP